MIKKYFFTIFSCLFLYQNVLGNKTWEIYEHISIVAGVLASYDRIRNDLNCETDVTFYREQEEKFDWLRNLCFAACISTTLKSKQSTWSFVKTIGYTALGCACWELFSQWFWAKGCPLSKCYEKFNLFSRFNEYFKKRLIDGVLSGLVIKQIENEQPSYSLNEKELEEQKKKLSALTEKDPSIKAIIPKTKTISILKDIMINNNDQQKKAIDLITTLSQDLALTDEIIIHFLKETILHGKNDAIDYLLQKNPKLHIPTDLIYTAISCNSLHSIKSFISREVDLSSALQHISCNNCSHEIVDEILKVSGINLEIKNNNGETPIQVAIRNHNVTLAQKFISAGANMKVKDKQGNTLLHLLATCNAQDFVKNKSHYEKLFNILVKEIDLDAQNEQNETALFLTIKNLNSLAFKIYFSSGADLSIKVFTSTDTPFSEIYRVKEAGTPLALLKYAIKNWDTILVDIINSLPATNKILIAPLLNDNDFDINCLDSKNETLLHGAIRKNDTHLFRILIREPKINIHTKGRLGHSPFQYAYAYQRKEMIETLFDLRSSFGCAA